MEYVGSNPTVVAIEEILIIMELIEKQRGLISTLDILNASKDRITIDIKEAKTKLDSFIKENGDLVGTEMKKSILVE